MVAVLVMELLREMVGEAVPLSVSPESVKVLVLVNVRERVLEISSDKDCVGVAEAVGGGVTVLVVVGDKLSEAVLEAEISSVKLKDCEPLRVRNCVRVGVTGTEPLIVNDRELVCSSVKVWEKVGLRDTAKVLDAVILSEKLADWVTD
jgi:hypothetical protein